MTVADREKRFYFWGGFTTAALLAQVLGRPWIGASMGAAMALWQALCVRWRLR